MKKRKLDNLDLKQREIDEYNKKHKTHYSYGMYTALVRIGKIIPDCDRKEVIKNNENKKVL